jgi:hypothetical protein
MIPEDLQETLYPTNGSLQGFGRGLFVSTTDTDSAIGLTSSTTSHQDPAEKPDERIHVLNGFVKGMSDAFSQLKTSNAAEAHDPSIDTACPLAEDDNHATHHSMKRQLYRLVEHVHRSHPERTATFRQELDNFHELFTRFLSQKNNAPLVWDKVQNLDNDMVCGSFCDPTYKLIATLDCPVSKHSSR